MRQVLTRTQGARGHAQALSGAAKEYSRDPAPPITGFALSPRSCASSENLARDAVEARLKRRYARVAHRTGPGAAVEQPSREQSVQATCGYQVSDDDIYLRESCPRPARSDKPPCSSARVLLGARRGASGSNSPRRAPSCSFAQSCLGISQTESRAEQCGPTTTKGAPKRRRAPRWAPFEARCLGLGGWPAGHHPTYQR